MRYAQILRIHGRLATYQRHIGLRYYQRSARLKKKAVNSPALSEERDQGQRGLFEDPRVIVRFTDGAGKLQEYTASDQTDRLTVSRPFEIEAVNDEANFSLTLKISENPRTRRADKQEHTEETAISQVTVGEPSGGGEESSVNDILSQTLSVRRAVLRKALSYIRSELNLFVDDPKPCDQAQRLWEPGGDRTSATSSGSGIEVNRSEYTPRIRDKRRSEECRSRDERKESVDYYTNRREIKRIGYDSAISEEFERHPPGWPTFSMVDSTTATRQAGLRAHSRLQFLTVPTVDTPGTSLLLHFNDRRYFFGNTHEGFQRAALTNGVKIAKMENIFLTGTTSWQTCGGIMGMILTLANAVNTSIAARKEKDKMRRRRAAGRRNSNGVQPAIEELDEPELNIHGGPNITHLLATARSFIFRHGMALNVNELFEGKESTGPDQAWAPSWEDERIQVWSIPVRPLPSSDYDTRPGPTSPRKRSFDEYVEDFGLIEGENPEDERNVSLTRSHNDQAIRANVVQEMFGSNWRHDHLITLPISEVSLPAKMYVRDEHSEDPVPYTGPMPGDEGYKPDLEVLVRMPWPGALIETLPPTQYSDTAMSYVVRCHKQRGKFRPDIAKSLGVLPGPDYASLSRGIPVKTTDGTTVTPEMVIGPGKPGGGAMIVELPTDGHVEPFLQRPELQVESVMLGVGAFIWILGPGVCQSEPLLQFMDQYKHFEHIISAPERCPNRITMQTAAAGNIQHHLVDVKHFPILQYNNEVPLQTNPTVRMIEKNTGLTVAEPGLKLGLEPMVKVIADDKIVPFNPFQIVEKVSPRVCALAKQAEEDVASKSHQQYLANQALHSPEAEIIFLGTGSAVPSKDRNVAGILVRVPNSGSYIFDAGENTLGQLRRMHSPVEVAEILRDLKMIFISHMHADHHLGTCGVINAWFKEVHGSGKIHRRKFREKPRAEGLREPNKLFVVGPENMIRWLSEYSSVEDFGYDKVIPLYAVPFQGPEIDKCELFWEDLDVGFNTSSSGNIKSAIRQATKLSNLVVCEVSHCMGATAVSVTFPNGFKFSYSGDCRPSLKFTLIGEGSTVLVHEATFEDIMEGDAFAKQHCTIGEAVQVGLRMKAQRILLTHFSQRYAKIPMMEDVVGSALRLASTDDRSPFTLSAGSGWKADVAADAAKLGIPGLTMDQLPRIGVAFDYMRVKVKDIASLEKYTPAFRELYKAEEEEAARRSSNLAR